MRTGYQRAEQVVTGTAKSLQRPDSGKRETGNPQGRWREAGARPVSWGERRSWKKSRGDRCLFRSFYKTCTEDRERVCG